MSYTPPTKVLGPFYGAFVYFAEIGKVIETVTVAEDDKPAGLVLTDWEELGCIEVATLGRETDGGETRYCFNGTSGLWEKKRTYGRTVSLTYELTIQEVSEFLLRVAHNAAAISSSDGSFVPNSQPEGAYLGWVKVQQQNGTEVVSLLDVWVELTMPNAAQIAGRSASTPQLRLEVIDTALNAGAFGEDIA